MLFLVFPLFLLFLEDKSARDERGRDERADEFRKGGASFASSFLASFGIPLAFRVVLERFFPLWSSSSSSYSSS
jgi:hypothetical protein